VRGSATTLLHVRVPEDLRPGRHALPLAVQVSNLHPRPGASLAATLTLDVLVEP
jgi:hypothetical protein